MKNFEKFTRIVVSAKLKRFRYSYLEVQFATYEETLTASHFWVANLKLEEINIALKVKNRKHFLSIAIYDIA